MTRKGIESDSSLKLKVRQGAGIILIFAGMILLGAARALISVHLGEGIRIFTFFGGALLLGLGFIIQGRQRRSR
jgi:hypothetical protein